MGFHSSVTWKSNLSWISKLAKIANVEGLQASSVRGKAVIETQGVEAEGKNNDATGTWHIACSAATIQWDNSSTCINSELIYTHPA
jgi:hypothetical protein